MKPRAEGGVRVKFLLKSRTCAQSIVKMCMGYIKDSKSINNCLLVQLTLYNKNVDKHRISDRRTSWYLNIDGVHTNITHSALKEIFTKGNTW